MAVNKRLIGAGAASGAFVNNENFKAVIYDGNGGTNNITVGFQPDFVWIKERDQVENHNLYDSSRGVRKFLFSNSTNAEVSGSVNRLNAFNSDGFTVGSDNEINDTGSTYVAWCWKANGGTTSSNTDGSITSTVQANAAAGFSIVTYQGTQANATVGHGLGIAPKLVITKARGAANGWPTLAVGDGGTVYGGQRLNETNANSTGNGNVFFQNTAPTTSVFTLGASDESNRNATDTIAYCFADVDGFQKISSYTGNGSTNGPIVNVGFEPAFVMIKNITTADNWVFFDNARNTSNTRTNILAANSTAAEYSEAGAKIDFLSNGFQSVGTGGGGGSGQVNKSANTYIYWAIAANPDTEAPTLASSFNVETWLGTSTSQTIANGFKTGLLFARCLNVEHHWGVHDIVRGVGKWLISNATDADQSGSYGIEEFGENSTKLYGNFSPANSNYLNGEYVGYFWKADDNEPTINTDGSITSITSVNANAGFSVVKFTGGGSVQTVGHGLSSAPEMILFKNLDSTGDWQVYHTGIGNGNKLTLNSTAASSSTSRFDSTSPTASVFTFNSTSYTGNIISYCFHSVTGYSKFGSYAGNGTTQTITTGFKPDFVMIKASTNSTSNTSWTIFDSRRYGHQSDTNPVYANLAKGEGLRGNGSGDGDVLEISFTSTGFKLGDTGSDNASDEMNDANKNYIYWAVAKNVPSNTTLANSFKAVTYTGNGSTNSITGVGFKPDFVWLKDRDSTNWFTLFDTLRGPVARIHSNSSNAQDKTGTTSLTSFDSDGFTLGSNANENTNTNDYIAWCWKAGNTWQSNIDGSRPCIVNANTANGFSIIKYTGESASSQSVGHGLTSTPELVMIKKLSGSESWIVWYPGASTTNFLELNGNSATQTGATWGGTHSSTVVNLQDGPSARSSGNGEDYIAYVWHSVTGFSKIGTYTGTGSDGNAVTTGFQPDFVMIKRINSTGGWLIFDSARNSSNPRNNRLEADNNSAEQTGSSTKFLDFNSNDFEANGSDSEVNASGGTYLYMAFKIN